MPTYRLTLKYVDEIDGTTSKQFTGEFIDFTTARGEAVDFLVDLRAATSASIEEWTLAEVVRDGAAPAAGSRVFERVQATVNLETAGKKASLSFPSPVAALLSGNSLDQTATEWADLVDNLTAASGWEISDGEHYDSTVSGKRVFVRSGSTNLPI